MLGSLVFVVVPPPPLYPHQIVSRLTTFCPQSHSYVVVFLQPALYLLHLDGEVVSCDAVCKGELLHLRGGCRGDAVSCVSRLITIHLKHLVTC